MHRFLIWIIGNDQYTPYLIQYLQDNDNVVLATTNPNYVNEKVRILSPCDMNELKADVIILPYAYNISFAKFGRVSLEKDFFIKQKDALFYTTALSNYSKIFAKKNSIKIETFFDLDCVKIVKIYAICDLIVYSLIENNESLLKDLKIGIINDQEITPYLIDKFDKMNIKCTISDSISNLLESDVIIIPSLFDLTKEDLLLSKNKNIKLINMYEDNISFSVIDKASIKKIYSLRMTKYAKSSYMYAFACYILNKLKED